MSRLIKVWPLFSAALIACSGDGPFAENPEPGLRIVAGADVTDTISTAPTQGLVVEVRGDDGRVLRGAEVRFESPDESRMRVSTVASSWWSTVAGAATDAQGRAAVRVQLGDRTGDGRIVISVPVFNLTDTARYTILPGNPSHVILAPQDTTISVGTGFTYHGTVVDRNGNPRQEAVTYEMDGDAITLSPSGDVTAGATGIAKVRIRADINDATAIDSGSVAVVPMGTVAWGDQYGMMVTTVAGDSLRKVNNRGGSPSWEPGGDRFVATYNGLVLVNADNTVAALPTPLFLDALWPEWSSDGFIYFSGFSRPENGWRLGRVRPDGTALEMIVPDEPSNMPSPSPDGTRIVYVGGDFEGPLRILDLETRTSTTLMDVTDAQGPRWSPDGNWIAFTRYFGALWLIRPDGTDAHQIGEHGLSVGLSWSPDSRWILGTEYSSTLVDVSTGQMSYLPYLRGEPSWKR